MSNASGGTGVAAESKVMRLTKWFVGQTYEDAVAQRDRYDVLINSMHAMMGAIYASEFYSTEKDSYCNTAFRQMIDDRLIIVDHIAMNEIVRATSALNLGDVAVMLD